MAEHNPSPSPVRAVYGFVIYLLCSLAFATYLAWAVVPDSVLDRLGLLAIFPQKYWAVAVPTYIFVVLLTFAFVIYPSMGLCITPELGDPRNVVDEKPRYVSANSSTEIGDMHPRDLLNGVFKKSN